MCRPQVTLFDVQQRTSIAELSTPFVKYVVWNADMSCVALLSKHAIIIADKKLGNAQVGGRHAVPRRAATRQVAARWCALLLGHVGRWMLLSSGANPCCHNMYRCCRSRCPWGPLGAAGGTYRCKSRQKLPHHRGKQLH